MVRALALAVPWPTPNAAQTAASHIGRGRLVGEKVELAQRVDNAMPRCGPDLKPADSGACGRGQRPSPVQGPGIRCSDAHCRKHPSERLRRHSSAASPWGRRLDENASPRIVLILVRRCPECRAAGNQANFTCASWNPPSSVRSASVRANRFGNQSTARRTGCSAS